MFRATMWTRKGRDSGKRYVSGNCCSRATHLVTGTRLRRKNEPPCEPAYAAFADVIRAPLQLRRLDIIAGRNHIDHGSEYAKAGRQQAGWQGGLSHG